MSRVFRSSLMLAGFFVVDKILALVRQIAIARQFGLSSELDVFNAANNLPDMLYALLSGGALALALIPVLSEKLERDGRPALWDLFSRILNLTFLVTAGMAVVIAVFAGPLVRWELGIAPGFTLPQQNLAIELMRLNLLGTLLFSLSGLVMAGLHANQHFLLPALAPLLYNLSQIFGALVLAPKSGLTVGAIHLPAFGFGIHGLLYGVILGAALHLSVQLPGLWLHRFRWTPVVEVRSAGVRQVLRLLGPRIITIFFVQLIFLARDNMASRLATGAVSALTYGWGIMQVPETVLGTALGMALLPTLGEQIARGDWDAFCSSIERAIRALLSMALPIAAVLAVSIRPLLSILHFDAAGTEMVVWTTRAYLVGLTGHVLLEVASRAYYAQQDARTPLLASALNAAGYILFSALFFRRLGPTGIGLSNTLAFSGEALFLLVLLRHSIPAISRVKDTLLRAAGSMLIGGGGGFLFLRIAPFAPLPAALLAILLGGLLALPLIWRDLRPLLAI